MAGDRKVSSWRGWPPRALLMDNNRDISPHPGGPLPSPPLSWKLNDYFRSYIATLNATMNALALVQLCVMHHFGVVVGQNCRHDGRTTMKRIGKD